MSATTTSQTPTGPVFTVQFCSKAPSPKAGTTPETAMHQFARGLIQLEKDVKQKKFLRKAKHDATIVAMSRDQQQIALHMLLAEAYRYQLQERNKVEQQQPRVGLVLLDVSTFKKLSTDVRLVMDAPQWEANPPAVVERHPFLYVKSSLQKLRLLA